MRWINKKFLVLIVLVLGIIVWLNLIFRPPLLASEVPSAGIINFLVDNTKDLSLQFDTANTDQPGDLNKPNEQILDLKDLGKLVFNTNSRVRIPEKLSLSGNDSSVDLSFGLQHQLEGVPIPPHIQIAFQAEASDSGLLDPEGKMASIKLSFEGLLLKGVPEYLSKTQWMKDPAQEGFVLTVENDNKATLSKVVTVSPEHTDILKKLRDTEAKLRDIQTQVQSLGEVPEELKKDARDSLAEKSVLLTQLFGNIGFPCGPEFSREFKFPIFERSASGSTGSASGSAAIGVSGDVSIDIKSPMCGVSMKLPFNVEAWMYTDMDITSHGFLGARAEGQASTDFGVTFKDKYDSYPVSVEISEEEKQLFNQIVLKTLDKAKNSEHIVQSVQQNVESKISEIHNSITTALIGDGTDRNRICSLFDQLGLKTPNSEMDLACNAIALAATPQVPSIPPPVFPPAPNLPPRPDGQCRAQLPAPPCSIRKEKICGVCEKCLGRGRFRVCSPVPCTNCSVKEIEVPPGCRAAKRAIEATNTSYRNVCSRLQAWENQVNQMNSNWEAQKREIQANWERESEAARQQANTQVAQAQRLQDPAFLLGLARQTIQDKVLRQVDTKAVAKKILDAAWKMNDWVDLTQDFVSDNVPQSLTLSIKGSSRASVTSRAHILHGRPKFLASSTLDIGQDGQPALTLSMSSIQNAREDGSGGIGGLDVNGFTLDAEQVITFGGNEVQRVKYKVERFNPTFDEGKITLSNQEETIYKGTYRYR